MLIPVILAGGAGSRLWPLSRRMHPKQFLPLTGGSESMMQKTISRLGGIERAASIVICNEEHRFLVAGQLQQLGEGRATIVLEPVGRNTAPAIAVAALRALQQGDDPTLLVLAADHVITQQASFHHAITQAVDLAQADRLVTFGIVPNLPETGYGYIRRGKAVDNGYQVAEFVEKPDQATAQGYLDSGDYYWNSGMFCFRAAHYLSELQKVAPDMVAACRQAVEEGEEDLDFFRLAKEPFMQSPSDSIDYAVMEKTDCAAVVPLDAGWNDIGSWSALWQIDEKDGNGNATKGDTLLYDTWSSLVHAESRLVTTVGVENLVVIETKDAVLVADKSQAQHVKEIVEALRAEERPEDQFHRVVYRPWGHFDSIEEEGRFKVKRITVKPGGRTSIQMHHHRSEHWIVVSGTARVTKEGKSFLVTENESIYINVGESHSLENPGVIPLDLIEVQTGGYLGEDDIVRYDDLYGRED